MGGDPAKLVKNMKGAAQKYLGVGFLLGFFLVLLTYFTVSEQFAITAPNGEPVVLSSNCALWLGVSYACGVLLASRIPQKCSAHTVSGFFCQVFSCSLGLVLG